MVTVVPAVDRFSRSTSFTRSKASVHAFRGSRETTRHVLQRMRFMLRDLEQLHV